MSNNHKLTILLVSDKVYLQYLFPIIRSIYYNSLKQFLIHVNLVHIDEKDPVVETLKNEFNNINISFTNDPVININFTRDNRTSFEALSANIRIRLIRDLLRQGIKYIIYLDVDSLVLQSLDPLLKHMQKYDLCLFKYPHHINPIKTGIICVSNTLRSCQFFEEFASTIEDKLHIWGSDQEGILALYSKYKNDPTLKLNFLSSIYLDWKFDDKSVIWTAKGGRKHNIKYLKQFNKYTKPLKKEELTHKNFRNN